MVTSLQIKVTMCTELTMVKLLQIKVTMQTELTMVTSVQIKVTMLTELTIITSVQISHHGDKTIETKLMVTWVQIKFTMQTEVTMVTLVQSHHGDIAMQTKLIMVTFPAVQNHCGVQNIITHTLKPPWLHRLKVKVTKTTHLHTDKSDQGGHVTPQTNLTMVTVPVKSPW